MPYIIQHKREEIKPHISPLLEYIKTTPELSSGDLNYITTKIIWQFYKRSRCYDQWNAISGALSEAKAEMRRRILTSYENLKIELNGDVYDDE